KEVPNCLVLVVRPLAPVIVTLESIDEIKIVSLLIEIIAVHLDFIGGYISILMFLLHGDIDKVYVIAEVRSVHPIKFGDKLALYVERVVEVHIDKACITVDVAYILDKIHRCVVCCPFFEINSVCTLLPYFFHLKARRNGKLWNRFFLSRLGR